MAHQISQGTSESNYTSKFVVKQLQTQVCKVFPVSLNGSEAKVKELIRILPSSVPIVILCRRTKDAMKSELIARKRKRWNEIPIEKIDKTRVIKSTRTKKHMKNSSLTFKEYITLWLCMSPGKKLREYFDQIEGWLRNESKEFDELWYEQIYTKRYIELKSAGCYIRNCNFEV